MLVYVFYAILLLKNITIYKKDTYNLDPLNQKSGNALKGMAILLVILNHISESVPDPGVLWVCKNFGYIAVDIFLFYSGYGLMKSYNKKKNYLDKFWSNRIFKIALPFILVNILFLLIYISEGDVFSVKEIFFYILGIKLIDDFKWYVICILIFYIGFYFIFKNIKDKIKAIVGMCILVITYYLICKLNGMGEWWYESSFCFLIGILFGEFGNYIFDCIKKRYLVVTLFMGTVFLITFSIGVYTAEVSVATIASCFFIMFLVCLLMKVDLGNKALGFVGNISYEIYLLHRIMLREFYGTNKYIYLVLTIVSSVLIAYIFNIFMKKFVNVCIGYICKKINNRKVLQNT